MAQSRPPLDHDAIEKAARLLRDGKLVAFPTETVYGLGANALDTEAVARIYEVKGRPGTSPLIVHIASIEMAKSLVTQWPNAAEQLARKFWPGPLTLVLPTNADRVPRLVTAGLDTVAIRMPAHPVALELIRAAGVPLAGPSANRFTRLSPTTADHVRHSLGSDVDFVLDGGACQVGIESTVLSLAEPHPVLLRPGGISSSDLAAVVGPISIRTAAPDGAHPSPGMHPRHYSPRTPLLLTSDGTLPATGRGLYVQYSQSPSRGDISIHQMPLVVADYAAALYRELHQADEAGFDWIAVELPPRSPAWDAVHDRLHRAASRS